MGRETILALLLTCASAQAAFEQTPRGARAVGLGGSNVSVEGDPWSAFLNPSCLPFAAGTSVAVEYVPAFFGLPEIKQGAFSLSRMLSVGPVSLSMSVLGLDLYREISVGVAAAHELNKRLVVGVGLTWYSLAIRRYGNDQALGFDIGALLRLVPGVSYGVALHNVNRPTIGSGEEPLPQAMRMGISVQPIPAGMVTVGAAKDSRYPFELSAGAEYCVEEILTLRLGVSQEPSVAAIGIGVRTTVLQLDYAYSMHPDLGATHCFSLSYVLPWP